MVDLERVNAINAAIASELDIGRLTKVAVESCVELIGAAFGAFFERSDAITNGEKSWHLVALAGAPEESFTRFGLPRETSLFAPTFRGEGIVRSDDVLSDPRYGSMGGMPAGHLPVRSYLASPIQARTGETIGGLIFGHPEPLKFGPRQELLIAAVARTLSNALDNAQLFQRVQREQDRFQAAVAATRGVLWTNDAEGGMRGEQRGWMSLTGQSRPEYEGYGWSSAVHPDDVEATLEAWNSAVAESRPFIYEHRVRRFDGSWRHCAIRAIPILETAGRIREWVGVHTDITEQREAEASLKASNDELQRYVYMVSHDLRSPLVNVLGYAGELNALKDDLLASSAKSLPDAWIRDFEESLGFITTAARRMDALLATMLKLARERGRRLVPTHIDVNSLVASLISVQQHQIKAVGAEVVVSNLPSLTTDRSGFEQVLANLIDNALKYRDSHRPLSIWISGEEKGNRVCYSVQDTGRGIDPADHNRIFDLFRRSGSQDVPGEGVGLSFVRSLVASMGGTITISSTIGTGSSFNISLPSDIETLPTMR